MSMTQKPSVLKYDPLVGINLLTQRYDFLPCREFEESYIQCLKGYGMYRSEKECENFRSDVYECMFGTKRFIRATLIEKERIEQGRPYLPRTNIF